MRFTVFCDLRITRRKLFHVVQNEAQETVFRSRLIGDCLRFAEAEGATEIKLTCVADRWEDEPGTYTVAKDT